MSWLYSQALVEEYWEGNSLDGEQSVQWKLSLMPQAFLSKDKMTAFSRLSRFGMTFAPLTESLGEELLMSYLEDSHVKTSVLRGEEQELKGKEAGCGNNSQELLAKYDPDSHSLRTAQCWLFEDLKPSSVTLPASGMMLNGYVYPLPTLELNTNAIESGLLPTPCAQMGGYNKSDSPNAKIRPSLEMMARHNLWPTPTRSTAHKEVISSQGYNNLVAFAKMYPTPVASDGKGAPSIENVRKRAMQSKRGVRLEEHLARNGEIGQLNPTWVEWLMGWPLGWTDLKPLEMDKYQNAQQKLGGC